MRNNLEYCMKCGWVDWFKVICPECKHDKRKGENL